MSFYVNFVNCLSILFYRYPFWLWNTLNDLSGEGVKWPGSIEKKKM